MGHHTYRRRQQALARGLIRILSTDTEPSNAELKLTILQYLNTATDQRVLARYTESFNPASTIDLKSYIEDFRWTLEYEAEQDAKDYPLDPQLEQLTLHAVQHYQHLIHAIKNNEIGATEALLHNLMIAQKRASFDANRRIASLGPEGEATPWITAQEQLLEHIDNQAPRGSFLLIEYPASSKTNEEIISPTNTSISRSHSSRGLGMDFEDDSGFDFNHEPVFEDQGLSPSKPAPVTFTDRLSARKTRAQIASEIRQLEIDRALAQKLQNEEYRTCRRHAKP